MCIFFYVINQEMQREMMKIITFKSGHPEMTASKDQVGIPED